MSSTPNPSAPLGLKFNGVLSDLDGTLIDSTAAIVKHWQTISEELNFDPAVVLATSHGRRSIDTLQLLAPDRANWEYPQDVHAVEARIPRSFGADAKPIAGAKEFLSRLTELDVPWGIVTSGSRALVDGWLAIMDLTPPQVMVTAEDVEVGKPNPACYLLGRDRIGLGSSSRSGPGPGSGSFSRPRSGQKQHLNQTQKQTQTQMQTQIQTQTQTQAAPSTSPLLSASISPSASHSFVPSILVLEDAPSGIRAGKAAGCTVIGVGTTHGLEDLIGAGVDYVVRDLTSVRILGVDRLVGQGAEDQVKVEIEIEISELLYAGAGILL